MERHGIRDLFLPVLPQPIYDPFGMVVGPLVVVGVVEQASDTPDLGIAAVLGGRRPHHDLQGSGVAQERGIRRPGLELLQGLVVVAVHGFLGNWYCALWGDWL